MTAPATVAGELAERHGPIAVERSPVALYLAGLARTSQRTQRAALDTIARILTAGRADAGHLEWAAVRREQTKRVREVLAERYKPNTADRMLCALRGVLKEAWRIGLMSGEAYARAVDVRGVGGSAELAGRMLSRDELAALFAACAADPSRRGRRDAAMLAVLYGAGVRVAELCNLRASDVGPDAATLRVLGKGRKERTMPLPTSAAALVREWLAVAELRGIDLRAALFPRLGTGGRASANSGMTPKAIAKRLAARGRGAKLAHCSPHDFRRTYVSELLERGADLDVVADLAGHSNVQTTRRYDRRGERAKRRAAELLDVPS